MDAYIFNADLLCKDCGEAKRLELDTIALAALAAAGKPLQDYDAWRYGDKAEYIRKHPRTTAMALGFDPEEEREYDSGVYPKGPTGQGGGEADSPQHCGKCGVFLENSLTEDGEKYVIETLISFAVYGDGNREALQTWYDFYHFNAHHGGLDANIVADAILETIGTRLDFAKPDESPASGCTSCGREDETLSDEGLCAGCAAFGDSPASFRENALFTEGQNAGSSRAIEGRE